MPGIVRLREKEPLPDPQPQWDARDLIAARAAPIDTGEPTIETTKHGRPTEEVNILVIGVDSRLGREQARADALQLLTIERDPVRVRITSIPRGTPCPLGYANPGSNIISHARSARGRDGLLVRVARLCGKPAIPYFVEFGFSQALGALELLGIGDPVATLHALRRRKGYQFGDRERSFLQGEFIRLHIGDALAKAEGLSGEILLAAALRFVETNLTKDQCLGLAYALRDAGVGRDPERIEHRMIGTYAGRIERNAAAIAARAEGTNHTRGETAGMAASRAEGVIRRALAQAERHTDAPRRVVSDLRRIYEQRGWLQVSDRAARFALRDSLAGVLLRAADAIGDRRLSAVVAHGREADIKLFGN